MSNQGGGSVCQGQPHTAEIAVRRTSIMLLSASYANADGITNLDAVVFDYAVTKQDSAAW